MIEQNEHSSFDTSPKVLYAWMYRAIYRFQRPKL